MKKIIFIILCSLLIFSCKKCPKAINQNADLTGKIKSFIIHGTYTAQVGDSIIDYISDIKFDFTYDIQSGFCKYINSNTTTNTPNVYNSYEYFIDSVAPNTFKIKTLYKDISSARTEIFIIHTNNSRKIISINELNTIIQTETPLMRFVYNSQDKIDSILGPDASPFVASLSYNNYNFDGFNYTSSAIQWESIYFIKSYSVIANCTYANQINNYNVPAQIPLYYPGFDDRGLINFASTGLRDNYPPLILYFLRLNGIYALQDNMNLVLNRSSITDTMGFSYLFNSSNQVSDIVITYNIHNAIQNLTLDYY